VSKNPLVNLLVAAVVSLLPLAGAPARIAHPGPWLTFLAGAVLLLSQPPLDPKTMVTDVRDRLTALSIFVAQIGSAVASLLEFGYRAEFRPAPLSVWVAAGGVLVCIGLALRLWAIRTLGSFFTSTVRVTEDQRVVDSGPYRVLRHPSYTGALVTPLGLAVALQSAIGGLVLLAAGIPAYLYRIRVEEAALSDGLGEAYRGYQERTWKLLPFVY
jgi:protein-S-isoprenylcysteine O-methyltransferase Ste14